jgi:hypothetical protein
MRVAFVVFAVLCLGGVFASLARGKLHGGVKEDRQAKLDARS